MVTEKGSVKVSTPLTERAQRELNKAAHTLGIIYVVLGAVLAVIFLVVSIVLWYGDSHSLVLFLAAIFIALGVFLLVACNRNVKEATRFPVVHEVEFFRGYFILREYTAGEHTSTNKVYYTRLHKVKESANYLFLYNSRATAVVVDKHNLPLNELNAVLRLLGRPAVGNAVNIPEQPFKAQTGAGQTNWNNAAPNGQSQAPEPDSNPPADPFEEFSDNGDGATDGKELPSD